jgi:hypothetical protein
MNRVSDTALEESRTVKVNLRRDRIAFAPTFPPRGSEAVHARKPKATRRAA